MSYCLGLTGSIGMGKTATAAMFAAQGVPVWDADETVHRLYARGGAAIAPLSAKIPNCIANGAVSRDLLREQIAADPAILDQIQAIVHPLIAADRQMFLTTASAPIILLDMPLLFEVGADQFCDGIAVVTAPAKVQRARVLARGTMNGAQLDLILSRQMPDAEKQARADWVIQTQTPQAALTQVSAILAEIRMGLANA